MIVADTSVWISHLNDIPTPSVALLRAIIDTDDDLLLVGDLIMLEILQGLRSEADAARVERAMTRFATASMLDPGLAALAARHYRALRGLGITLRKTPDLVIGTFCIARGHALLHDDRDFDPMQHHLGLRVLTP